MTRYQVEQDGVRRSVDAVEWKDGPVSVEWKDGPVSVEWKDGPVSVEWKDWPPSPAKLPEVSRASHYS